MITPKKSDTPFSPKSQKVTFSPDSESFWSSLPSSPGVYFFVDENNEPLYIGKSINLRSRIRQHYEASKNATTKAHLFVQKTKSLYLKLFENDIQAIISESNYIKTHQPRYNSITKDGKSNTYLVFTNPPTTKLVIAHGTDIHTFNLDNYQKQVFGPYSSGQVATTLLKIVRKTFGICLNPLNTQQRACFNYHLQRCPGVCCGKIASQQYQKHLQKIKKFLSGKFVLLRRQLQSEIKKQIKLQDFESADQTKKQIQWLENTISVRSVSNFLKLSDANYAIQSKIIESLNHPKLTTTPRKIECYDLAHLQTKNYVGAMSVFVDGEKSPKDYRKFIIDTPDFSDPHGLRQVIKRRLQHKEWSYPDLIVVDGGIPQLSIVSEVVPSEIPLIALAKKRETIYFYDNKNKIVSLNLPIEDPVLNLFRNLRDEVHRLANSFHRKRQNNLE